MADGVPWGTLVSMPIADADPALYNLFAEEGMCDPHTSRASLAQGGRGACGRRPSVMVSVHAAPGLDLLTVARALLIDAPLAHGRVRAAV